MSSTTLRYMGLNYYSFLANVPWCCTLFLSQLSLALTIFHLCQSKGYGTYLVLWLNNSCRLTTVFWIWIWDGPSNLILRLLQKIAKYYINISLQIYRKEVDFWCISSFAYAESAGLLNTTNIAVADKCLRF